MNEINIILSLPVLISFSFSLTIFIYMYSFENKKSHLIIYRNLFLIFIFSGFTYLYVGNQNLNLIFINFSFFIFFLFIYTTYKDYSKNLDFYYLTLILFFLSNFSLVFSLVKYQEFFIYLSKLPVIYYLSSLLSLGLIIFHKVRKAQNQLIFKSYFLVPLFFLTYSYKENIYIYFLSNLILVLFFSIHFINARKQLYVPLLNKIGKLEAQSEKRNAELPEHIRQKFQIMENNKAKLMDMAYTDKMTGICNKDKITSTIRDLILNPKVEIFSILMFDIDNFKNINDNLGHLIGDECIIDLARIGSESIRKNDSIGRYGGDEFIIVLPTLNAFDSRIIAERFQSKIQQQTKPKFTVSVGIASYPEDGQSLKELIESADKALYLSKKRGKNKVSHIKHF